MTTQTEAQRLAAKMKSYKLASGYAWHCHKAGDELRRLEAANAELLDALKGAGLFLHHCWCDVAMNDYSFEKLKKQMEVTDSAIKKHGGAA